MPRSKAGPSQGPAPPAMSSARQSRASLYALIPSVLAALVAVIAASAARAEGPGGGDSSERLAITRLEFDGNLPQPLRESLAARLVEGLTTVGFEVVRPRGHRPGALRRCSEPDCLRELAEKVNARYLVGRPGGGERQDLRDHARPVRRPHRCAWSGPTRERCEICGAEEVGEKMSLAAAALRARLSVLARAPVRFVIRTHPHGAAIKIDDRPVGETPVDVTLAAGAHRMFIEREGFFPLERSFTVTSGVDETLDLDLVSLPSPFPYRAAGWSALAAGTVLAAGGVYLLGLDGRRSPAPPSVQDGGGRCPRVYRTNVAGAALLGASAVSATLGGVWLFLAPPASRQRARSFRGRSRPVLIRSTRRSYSRSGQDAVQAVLDEGVSGRLLEGALVGGLGVGEAEELEVGVAEQQQVAGRTAVTGRPPGGRSRAPRRSASARRRPRPGRRWRRCCSGRPPGRARRRTRPGPATGGRGLPGPACTAAREATGLRGAVGSSCVGAAPSCGRVVVASSPAAGLAAGGAGEGAGGWARRPASASRGSSSAVSW